MSSGTFHAEKTGADAYRIGETIPVAGFETVPAGTNVLVSGPPMVGKERLALELLATDARDEHAIAITPDTGGDRLRRRYETIPNVDGDRFHVIDCSGSSGKGSMSDTARTKYVSSPGDLTGIGMGIVKCTRHIGVGVDDGLRLATLSLSTLVRYATIDRVFNFLHTVNGRVAAADYLGVATLDPTVHDSQDVNTLTSLFDAVVELREADDGSVEGRVVGWRESPRTWQPF